MEILQWMEGNKTDTYLHTNVYVVNGIMHVLMLCGLMGTRSDKSMCVHLIVIVAGIVIVPDKCMSVEALLSYFQEFGLVYHLHL